MSGELPVVDPLEAIADPSARVEFQRLGKRIEDMQSTLADMKGMLSTLLASQNTPSGSGAPSAGEMLEQGTSAGGGHAMAESDPSSVQHGDSGGTMETPLGRSRRVCGPFSTLWPTGAARGKTSDWPPSPKWVRRMPRDALPQLACVCDVQHRRSSRHVRGPELVSRVRVQVKMTLTSTKQPMHWCITTCSDAVANVSVLSDSVQRFLDMPNSAQLAWGQSRSTLCAPLTACSRTSQRSSSRCLLSPRRQWRPS